MQVNILISCPKERIRLLHQLGHAARTPLVDEDPNLVMPIDFTRAATCAQLVENLSLVWQEIREHVSALSGACRLLDNRSDLEVQVTNAYYVDEFGERHWLPIIGRLNVFLDDVVAGSHEAEVSALGAALQAGRSCAKVMRLFNRPLDWINLYRIFEVVKEDLGSARELVTRGWVMSGELERFKLSANHPAVTGDDARHGSMPGHPNKKMEHGEATAFIKRIVRGYLREAVAAVS